MNTSHSGLLSAAHAEDSWTLIYLFCKISNVFECQLGQKHFFGLKLYLGLWEFIMDLSPKSPAQHVFEVCLMKIFEVYQL